MKQELTPDWQAWTRLNLSRGCDKDGIARILFENDFHPAAIVAAMQYLPQSGELITAMNAGLASGSTATAHAVAEPGAAPNIPAYTREGFRKGLVPADLMQAISAFYSAQRPASLPEVSDAIGTFIRAQDARPPARMIELDAALRARISAEMQPLLEAWAGRPLRMTATYGIREYQSGATLDMHIDRLQTHIISAIVNVAQQVTADWPLYIHDHAGHRHAAYLKPGEMLLYESARLKHGRPEPLAGTHFANIFVHAMPI